MLDIPNKLGYYYIFRKKKDMVYCFLRRLPLYDLKEYNDQNSLRLAMAQYTLQERQGLFPIYPGQVPQPHVQNCPSK